MIVALRLFALATFYREFWERATHNEFEVEQFRTDFAAWVRHFNLPLDSLTVLAEVEEDSTRDQDQMIEVHAEGDDIETLCRSYHDAGAALLALRQNPIERLHWGQVALNAARHLELREAEGRHLTRLGRVWTIPSKTVEPRNCLAPPSSESACNMRRQSPTDTLGQHESAT